MIFMKLFLCFALQIGICSSSLIRDSVDESENESIEHGNTRILDIFEDDELYTVDDHHIKMEDYCSFVKLEKPVDPLPDPKECERINDLFKMNDEYNFINYFGNAFNLLTKGADSFLYNNYNLKMNTVLFIGITGSGKTTLVQILGNNNSKLYSVPVTSDKTDFIIVDYSKIGENTIVSETLYPELIADNETGYILCDSQGFRDTRSPVHEIVAMYSIKKILRHTDKIKIVLVTTHSSVKVGMYREDFPNLLRHTVSFVRDIDKYKNSFYLIANKVENTYFIDKNGKYTVINDYNVTNGIGDFLNSIEPSINDKKNKFKYNINNSDYVKGATKLIKTILQKENDIYKRIKILRKPVEDGPISNITQLQIERSEIRNMLLNNDNMVEVDVNDFGITLSDSAVIYLQQLYNKMNTYITEFSNLLSVYVTVYYRNILNTKMDMNDIISKLLIMDKNIKSLTKDLETCQNSTQYINIISKFSEQNKLNLDCLNSFKNISTLNEYLNDLQGFLNFAQYSSLKWESFAMQISVFINESLTKFKFLLRFYEYLNSYEIQKVRKSYNTVLENIEQFLNINVANGYIDYESDLSYLKKAKGMIKHVIKRKYNFPCISKSLIIMDYNVLFSELTNYTFNGCEEDPTNVVILAMHTIFIDADLPWLMGKHLTIISPIWEIIGSRRITIDGISGGEAPPKAYVGEIGQNGENGKPGRKFYGIGETFVNGNNLIISASGGDGQPGQEGGDGENGDKGAVGDETKKELVDTGGISFKGIGYNENVYIARGSSGENGGDAGAGGKGGRGGKKGSVILYNIGKEDHHITIIAEPGRPGDNGKDGKPGKGGIKGCDKIIKKNTISAFGVSITLGSDTEIINCDLKNNDGQVRKERKQFHRDEKNSDHVDSPVCVHIMKFQDYYLKGLHSTLTDGVTKKFISNMKLTKY